MIDVLITDIVFDWTFLKPLIERDDGKKESNEVDESTQQALAQAEISPEIYYQTKEVSCKQLWCDNYNQHWTLSYKTTSTPCSCWLCKGERYNRRKFKEETKLEIEMF